MPKFEFDPAKSKTNLLKHAINFEDAQQLLADPDLLEIQAMSDDEPRYLYVGCIGKKIWSAIATFRGNKIRIISVRRSRQSEVALYESKNI